MEIGRIGEWYVPPELQVEVEVQANQGSSKRIRSWSWSTGQALSYDVDGYLSRDRLSPVGLEREFRRWDTLSEAGFAFERSDIVRGGTGAGLYFYVQGELEDEGLRCLFFRKGDQMPGIGFSNVDGTMSGGEISGFDCQPVFALSANEHEEFWTSILNGETPVSRAQSSTFLSDELSVGADEPCGEVMLFLDNMREFLNNRGTALQRSLQAYVDQNAGRFEECGIEIE